MKALLLSCLWMLLLCTLVKAQDTATLAGTFSRRYAARVEQKADKVAAGLTRQSEKALKRLQRQQQRVYKSLYKLDSNAAKAYLQNSQAQFQSTLLQLNGRMTTSLQKTKGYIPGLDSMTGVLVYLDKFQGSSSLPNKEQLVTALAATKKATNMLDQSTEVKKLILQQQQQLKILAAQYKNLPVTRQLKACSKELYYYSQRVQQAKETLNDPARIEREMLRLLSKNSSFRQWMQQHGQLSGLFGNRSGNAVMASSLAGLQTRQQIQGAIRNRMGGNMQQAQQLITGGMQQAQSQFNQLRSRLQQFGGSASGTTDMPDFTPNNQKTKPFWERLEKGWNLQAIQRSGILPSVNELGLSLGYKLNDKSVIGVGAAYRFGLGERIQKLRWTNEGISLRTYVDVKWKGNWWISGGYEQSYWSRFNRGQIGSLLWQKAALAGLTKKVMVDKKREMKVQLFYDFFRRPTDSKSFPFVLRTGVNF